MRVCDWRRAVQGHERGRPHSKLEISAKE